METPYFNFLENKFLGALALETLFSQRLRDRIAGVLSFLILIALLLVGYAFLREPLSNSLLTIPPLPFPARAVYGFLLILLAPRLFIAAVGGFINSKTYHKKGEAPDRNMAVRFNFYAAEFWYRGVGTRGTATLHELVRLIPRTHVGASVCARLGIDPEAFSALRTALDAVSEKDAPGLSDLILWWEQNRAPGEDITFTDIVLALFELQSGFRDFLVNRGIKREDVGRAAAWMESTLMRRDLDRRWWNRHVLGRVPGIAKDWAYGKTFLMEKYAVELTTQALSSHEDLIGREREIELLEAALLRGGGANALLVGEAGAGKHTVLLGLVRMIAEGRIFPELAHKRVWQLYGEAVVASGKEKGAVEELLLFILQEASRAGNIILVIDDFPEFVTSLSALGISAPELLSPFFGGTALHFIALADAISFRRVLENNAGIMRFFDKVEVSEPDEEKLVIILEDLVPEAERAYGAKIFFTYLALQRIAEGAARYLVNGALPKRAVDLLDETAEEAVRKGMLLVTPEFVTEIIQRKTKMPLGQVSEEEREKLLALEDVLRKRVVGQEEAIRAVADAVRRARTEIRNPKRPIGTFLFLGPTGVGKTETAKALAAIYFGSEDAMTRFDMTEYQTDESIQQLVGSFAKNEPGLLASRMRSAPYSLVLLDEFEKASKEVRNLFLQVLDEGFFSDYLGERINMRNAIIVATSNAGSAMIGELMRQGVDATRLASEIIVYIQKEKILSPELLNRFDALIVFHPLGREILQKIASLMLDKLVNRLKEQNMTLVVTEDLIVAVAEGGYSPEFGARPMQRFIQDHVEKVIAEKIIKGEIKPGSEFTIFPADWES